MSNEWNNISIDKENIINEFRKSNSMTQNVIISTLSIQREMMRLIGNESDIQEIQRQIDELEQISQERRN